MEVEAWLSGGMESPGAGVLVWEDCCDWFCNGGGG